MSEPIFYLSPPGPCPYLPGLTEQRAFTWLGEAAQRTELDATTLSSRLTGVGFRRSGEVSYRPYCDGCQACVSVRVVVREHAPTRSMRRVATRNADLSAQVFDARDGVSAEQYALFSRYLRERHAEGGMASMSVDDYADMFAGGPVDTRIVEYRLDDELVAVGLHDVLEDGLSLVYSFFDPRLGARSLGTHVILDHITQSLAADVPYLYLGYWVDGSPTMDYKARFRPQERLGPAGWSRCPHRDEGVA